MAAGNSPRRRLVDISARISRTLQAEIVLAYAELDTLFDEYSLGQALGEVEQLGWFASHVGGLERAGESFVWITGWTDDLTGRRPAQELDRSGTRALLRFAPPPAGMRPPQVLDNPRWLRPFELFARLLGIPAADEADPTPLLAVVVPLLFGYMFGDVGQGLVLVLLGVLLQPSLRGGAARHRRRAPPRWSSDCCSAASSASKASSRRSGCTRWSTR